MEWQKLLIPYKFLHGWLTAIGRACPRPLTLHIDLTSNGYRDDRHIHRNFVAIAVFVGCGAIYIRLLRLA